MVEIAVLVARVALVREVVDVDDCAVSEFERGGPIHDLVDPGVQISVPPLLSSVIPNPDPVVVAGHEHDPAEEPA